METTNHKQMMVKLTLKHKNFYSLNHFKTVKKHVIVIVHSVYMVNIWLILSMFTVHRGINAEWPKRKQLDLRTTLDSKSVYSEL